ncbi:MAG: hypothetical protein HYR70_02080 [Chloroflexi bacterium]|nr:hypothetical protein [Chloroflexota bacterium]MBI1856035.1 hypothetical protein [Chloroflexota bacterium]MBI3341021.1 hypothetical protein [Chloroflexota bacterium]
MKKVIASAAGILFAVFSVAILGLLMSLTFGALGMLFPGSFTNQIWGLVLFDIAAMVWALVFVFKSESTSQYAIAAIGFIAAFLGTLGMVAVDVMLGGQTYVKVEDWVGQWLVYGFVIMTAIHSALLYAHHATAPNISEKINVGIARGEIVSEAVKQATQSLEVQKAELAKTIHEDIVNQVKRDLGLSRAGRQVIDLPALPVPETQNAAPNSRPAFSISQLFPFLWKQSDGNRTYESTAKAEEAGSTPPAPLAGTEESGKQ